MFGNIYQNKKILITGHTGFKGSWLSLWLTQLGAKVAGYSCDIPTEPSHFEKINLSDLIEDHRGDVTDFESYKSLINEFRPDLVFHLAAEAIVRTCIDNPLQGFRTNALGVMHLLEILRTGGQTQGAVIITSDKCYENIEVTYGYKETDRLGGKDPYSASKACAEIAFSSYYRTYFQHDDSLPLICTTRAGNVIGGGDWAENRIVPDAMKAWAQNTAVSVRSPNATRPWQHVLEPLSGYLLMGQKLLEKNRSFNGQSYNFGPAPEVNQTVEELLIALKKTWDGKINISPDQTTAKQEAGLLKLDCEKALSDLSWKATLNFDQTAEITARWYKEFYQNKNARELSLAQISEYHSIAKDQKALWAL